MAGNEMAVTVPETREFYWSKIERQIEREARSPAPFELRAGRPGFAGLRPWPALPPWPACCCWPSSRMRSAHL